MIAVFVTALGASAAFSLITTCASANSTASDYTIAANAARQEIEILRSMEVSGLTNRIDAPFIGSVPQLANLADGAGTLTIADYGPAPGAKQVTVTVTWTSKPSNRDKSLTMTTLIAEDGIGS